MYILGHIEFQKLVGATENTVINMLLSAHVVPTFHLHYDMEMIFVNHTWGVCNFYIRHLNLEFHVDDAQPICHNR